MRDKDIINAGSMNVRDDREWGWQHEVGWVKERIKVKVVCAREKDA